MSDRDAEKALRAQIARADAEREQAAKIRESDPVGRLVQLMQRFGAPISGLVDCEVIRSAPEGAIATSCDPGRTRLSFVFAAPGEDGSRPSSEFAPYEPDEAKAAFLSRMAALYDQHGEPTEVGEDSSLVRWVLW